jgi:hypothetical protein
MPDLEDDEANDPTSEEIMQTARELAGTLPCVAIALARNEVDKAVVRVAMKCGIEPKERMITNVRLLRQAGEIDYEFWKQLNRVRDLGNKALYAPQAPLLTKKDAEEYLPLAEQALQELKDL